MSFMIITGCAPLLVTKSWQAEFTGPVYYTKILVIKMVRDSSANVQMNMEEEMAGELKKLGYNAVFSFQEYGAKAFENAEDAAAWHEFKNSGIDAVITITLLHVEKERVYIPNVIYYPPYGDLNRFALYQADQYNRIYGPQYQIIDTKYMWESNLYDVASHQLVYSIQLQSFPPESSVKLSRKYARLVITDMVRKKILRDPREPLFKKDLTINDMVKSYVNHTSP